MLKIHGNQSVEGFSPQEVFDAGSLTESLPQMESITISSKEEQLQLGSQMAVDLFVPVPIPVLPVKKIELEAEVVECEPGKMMLIRGESEIASASLMLELEKLRRGKGTGVHHELAVDYHANLVTRKIVEAAIKGILEGQIEEFSNIHIANIEQLLGVKPKRTKEPTVSSKPVVVAA